MINVQDEYRIEDWEDKPKDRHSKKPKHNFKSPVLQNQARNIQNLDSLKRNLGYTATPDIISKHVNKFKSSGTN